MPLYHIVLMKPKPDVKTAQLAEFISSAQSMPGKITGLRSLKAGTPQLLTASRSQGFGMAVVAVLEQLEDLEVYIKHPIHVEFHEKFSSLFDDMLAYDMEFWE